MPTKRKANKVQRAEMISCGPSRPPMGLLAKSGMTLTQFLAGEKPKA